MNKLCKKCGLIKNQSEFHRGQTKDGYKNTCKICCNKIKKEYDKLNTQKNVEYRKKLKESGKRAKYLENYNKLNSEKISNSRRKYRESETAKKIIKNWREKNSDKLKDYDKKYQLEYRIKNKEKIAFRKKKYREKNKDKITAYRQSTEFKNKMKEWREKNKHIIVWRNILRRVLRAKNITKIDKTINYLGYTANEFKEYISKLFTDGMSWNNYGEWHIDHIKRVKDFPIGTSPTIVNALSNLRPMWATTRTINGILYEGNLNRSKY